MASLPHGGALWTQLSAATCGYDLLQRGHDQSSAQRGAKSTVAKEEKVVSRHSKATNYKGL